ncbi:MAG: carboxypeptidase-like regulatory domain-containing protein [Bacteroidota bacterium]
MDFIAIDFLSNKRANRILSLALFIVLNINAAAQSESDSETFNVSGWVYSGEMLVPYAHIYIEGTNYGTVSNINGEFLLKVPIHLGDQVKVIISCIGFESAIFRVNELIKKKRIISLVQATYLIPELVVVSKLDSATIILKKAIAAIKDNYPKKRHQIEAFYRELSIKDTAYTRLIEASILVDEPNYKGLKVNKEDLSIEGNRVKVLQLRKSEDNRAYDLLGWAFTKALGERNDIYAILDDNYVRFIGRNTDHFLSQKFLKEYDIDIVGKTTFEGNPVVILSLSLINESFFLREVKIYINMDDFAILKFENNLLINPKSTEMLKYAIDQKYFYQSVVSYKKIHEAYVPFHIKTRKYASNTNPLANGVVQYSDLEFLLIDLFLEDFDRLRSKGSSNRGSDINNESMEYNKGFWDSYNSVILNPISTKAKMHLEKKKPLDSQFKKN